MPRITPLNRNTAPPEAAELFDRDLELRGYPLNSTQIAAYRPAIAKAAKQLGAAIADGGLIGTQLRLLINVRVATLVGCPF
jgi:hypothetical protein